MLFILVQATITLNLAQNATPRRGKYIKPFRNQAIEEIRRLIVQEGYTPLETMNMLKIPPRTFRRYMHEAFAPERQILATKLTAEEVLNQLAILESRLTKTRRDLINTANDPNVDPKRLTAVVSAFNLSEEIALAIWKIPVEAAPGLLKRYGLELSNRYDGEEEEEENENSNV